MGYRQVTDMVNVFVKHWKKQATRVEKGRTINSTHNNLWFLFVQTGYIFKKKRTFKKYKFVIVIKILSST